MLEAYALWSSLIEKSISTNRTFDGFENRIWGCCEHLGGTSALEEIATHVLQIGCWWP